LLARILLSLVLCGLFACGGSPRAPIEDRAAQPQPQPLTYTVKSGDTLYSIAFRYGLDYRKVAAANGIGAAYTIYPGQTIYLNPAAPPGQPGTVPAAPVGSPVLARTPPPAPAPAVRSVYAPSAVVQSTPAVKGPAPAPAPAPALTPAPSPSPAIAKVKQEVEANTYTGAAVGVWLWPTRGAVTRGYSEAVHKGVDIGGGRGDPIVASAAGKVVYAGTGIVGFGELLIIKHNDVYLSAYGHNDRLLVSEGQTVEAGQTIAEKGSTGTDTIKLHFEIRKEGKPIDPQRLLAKR
jgi:lipoprotein NlpD